jgi:hypothetical protein
MKIKVISLENWFRGESIQQACVPTEGGKSKMTTNSSIFNSFSLWTSSSVVWEQQYITHLPPSDIICDRTEASVRSQRCFHSLAPKHNIE